MLQRKRPYSHALILWVTTNIVVDYILILNLMLHPVYIVLIGSNIATFLLYGYDKFQASRHANRVPERVLWLTVVLGGTVGALLGMYTFRHKTQKLSFQIVVAFIMILQILAILWLVQS